MRTPSLTLGLIAVCLVPGQLWADTVPPQLRNKTITMAWSTQRTVMTPRGERHSPMMSVRRLIYVSSNGRFFVKASFNARDAEVAPGDKTPKGGARDLKFIGGKLVGLAQLGKGAGRMTISFDQAYSSCSVDVAYGMPAGQRVTFQKRGVTMELLGVSYSGKTCSIREGNAFAN